MNIVSLLPSSEPMSELQAQVADLETKIEELSLAVEHCRKIEVIAKSLTTVGGALALGAIVEAFGLGPTALLTGIAAVLGGLALMGSNRRTLDDTTTSIRAHEAQRAELIDTLPLKRVPDGITGTTSLGH